MDLENTLNRLHIDDLNDMQKEVVSAMFRTGKDLIVLSPTGSGKTIAYLLPLAEMMDAQSDRLQALVLVPGRELAVQSERVFNSMGCGMRAMALYGGRPAMDEHRQLRGVRPQIVFATPGRINDHIDKGNVSMATVRFLVIDEFDKCLAMGFRDEMMRVSSKLHGVRRRLLLSATDAEGDIPAFVNMRNAVRIDYISRDEQVPGRIAIYKVRSDKKDKLDTLERLLRTFGDESTIVFLNYRDSVERTDAFLRSKGFVTSAFHGGMEQRQREDALYKFSNGSANVLVGTDLASRGLDIPDVNNIVHYQLPVDEDSYIHRVGRTARWDKTGRAFFILGPDESVPGYVECAPSDYPMPDNPPAPALPRMVTLYIGKGKNDNISRTDILGFLCKKGGVDGSCIGRIDVKERYAYAAVMRGMAERIVSAVRGEKIKGVKTVFEIVR